MARWYNKVVGEMSKLRNSIMARFGIVTGTIGATYKLDSSRVDYKMARSLYYNEDDNYKLGAGFAKPIVNIKSAFIGVPDFNIGDKEAKEILDAFTKANRSKMQDTHRNALREGDCFVWITREEEKDKSLYPELSTVLKYNILPPEMVKKINRDPLTNEPIEYVLESETEWEDDKGYKKKAKIIQTISRGLRVIEVDGDEVPPGVEPGKHTTPWDFIPIIHFKNEDDETAAFGKSELEPIEPFLKAYHDVTLHAIKGSKMHSTPRLKLKLKDVKAFLANNFGITDPAKYFKDGNTIDLDGQEMLILTSEDDAEFIEARSATGDAKGLLQLLFYCIVDASEIPEFIFGVHTPSSLSSVKEQMPIMMRSIERKRDQFTSSWQQLARMVLAMTAQSENKSFSTFANDLVWEKIDPRDGKEIAEELKITVEALTVALNNNIISHEAAVSYLAKLVETMNEYETEDPEIEGEKDRIALTKLERSRLGDETFLEKQLSKIKQSLDKKAV
ncbi:MAG TPA: phage portal protein [Bacillus bacterium]|uniref:phage portal protein n=1 Tax=Siminovitchia fordii TaxID=254759 RepID=UPI000372923C|nr:phage portal protein [Siminovitchia fordii]HBZ09129.1 phage portal protein [Bacillus sp. (in: firmicutes)]